MFSFLAISALNLIACDPVYQYGGYQIYDHFPLDGQRSWEYANDDISVDHKLEVRLEELTVQSGSTTVHEFQYFNQTTGSQEMAVQWSSDSSDGVLIHGYQTFDIDGGGAGATLESFSDSPVVFGESEMAPGEFVTSEAGAWSFTSTFEAVEPCSNHWVGDDWDSCLRFALDDNDGDPTSGAPFAGTYWIVPRYGIAWMELTGDPDTWILVTADWAPTE